ncbi:Chaperonin Cpn60/TCP-1 [Carpediemonas membranifera]|uniref:Chaperonin Cpn60/TCP-1 n=1 Tax=Carpediemonas membranifera TaxID=201153 RepID=A0A8J6E1W9_9EUKA|nr:Chaperonin Cpn60/TCP-1 [Carpediemonas membranifera]|eukprot:KAG9393983.1 Chaperonin Cpn60/TCP-1 [Carpediemonas membranifera]
MFLQGERTFGQSVRTQNVNAAVSLGSIVSTSFGPLGLDKMIVSTVGDITVTNDGATILSRIDVQHPAARVLVQLSRLQDMEVGDGTTTVVILASELLKLGNNLIEAGIHPTNVMSGYRRAVAKATKFLEENMSHQVSIEDTEVLMNVARTSMSSKNISNPDYFSRLVVDSLRAIKNSSGKFPVENVPILKAVGGSSNESQLIEDGIAIPCMMVSPQMPSYIKDAKIAILDFALKPQRMATGVQIQVTDPDKLRQIKEQEESMLLARTKVLTDAGANVILTTGGIDGTAAAFLVENGVMGVQHCDKRDLRHIIKNTGGKILLSFADLDAPVEGDEYEADTFEEALEDYKTNLAGSIGSADTVSEELLKTTDTVGDLNQKLLFIRGGPTSAVRSIILRGSSEEHIDETERSVHDALCAVKRVLESSEFVPGGGCAETAVSVFLERKSVDKVIDPREQLALDAFGKAMLVIPKILAKNAAKDATELVAGLRAKHIAAQKAEGVTDDRDFGLDLVEGVVRNNFKAGVLEPLMSKIKSLNYATEAAITVLRIDDVTRLENPEQQQAQQ